MLPQDDHKAAAFIMALDEWPDTIEDFNFWRDHWENHFPEMIKAEHFGDCTKAPMTCLRCQAENALERVPVYRKILSASEEPAS